MEAEQEPDLQKAVAALRGGGVVLHATEGVWGLACDPRNANAIEKIFAIKQRVSDKGLLLIGAEAAVFGRQLAKVPHRQEIIDSWPGHHTWILPNHDDYSTLVTGGRETVACRVPGHLQARQLCAAMASALVSTSANLSGQPPLTTQRAAQEQFAGVVDFVLPGAVGAAGRPSTIHDLDGNILR